MNYNYLHSISISGPLIQKILGDMEARLNEIRQNETGRHQMMMYSAHDVTIAANLQVLEMYSNIHPPYASAVIYELHVDDTTGKDFVKVCMIQGKPLIVKVCTIHWKTLQMFV